MVNVGLVGSIVAATAFALEKYLKMRLLCQRSSQNGGPIVGCTIALPPDNYAIPI
jgi:hypothetical protein